jgi:hypothetical protein
MTLSSGEANIAQIAITVGELIEREGRELFKKGQYEDLDSTLRLFFNSNTAGTAAMSRLHFYGGRLSGLFANWLFPKYAKTTGYLQWFTAFPSLLQQINSSLMVNDFSTYLLYQAHAGLPMRAIVDEVVSTIQLFVQANPQYALP